MVKIECDGIGRRYGAAHALRGLSLVVEGGELLVVLGPSGSGKTTLLNILAGLDAPSAGTVRFNGEIVNSPRVEVAPRDRKVGVVFQDLGLWPHMTVRRHLHFALGRSAGSRDEKKERIAETLAMLEIDSLRDRYPHELSGGEQQRLALARALVTSPQILLLDEPLGSLDPPLRERLVRVIRRVHEERNLTTVHVTHDRAEAFGLADRIAMLRQGAVVQVDTPDRMWDSPADAFVADLLGAGYVIKGQIVQPGSAETVLGTVHMAGDAPSGEVRFLVAPGEVRLCGSGEGVEWTIVHSIFRTGAWVAEVAIGGEVVGVHSDKRLRTGDRARIKLCGVPKVVSAGDGKSH